MTEYVTLKEQWRNALPIFQRLNALENPNICQCPWCRVHRPNGKQENSK